MTCSTIARPQIMCSGLGRAERMRVPSPAARTIAETLMAATACGGLGGRVTQFIAPGRGIEPLFTEPKSGVLPIERPRKRRWDVLRRDSPYRAGPRSTGSLPRRMGSLIKKRRKRMRKKKHKKMLRAPATSAASSRRRPAALAAAVRATTTAAPSLRKEARASSRLPGTNHVAPLPASTGVTPASSPMRSRQRGQRRLDDEAAGSRSLGPSPVGPPSSSHARYTAGVLTCSGGTTSVTVQRLVRQRLDDLADAPHPGPAADEAERHVGAQPRRRAEVVEPGPAQHGGGVGRAAAEPAAVGDPLVDVHGGRRARRARRARATRLRVVGRHAVGVRPADRDRRRRPGRSSARRRGRGVTISASSRW